MIKMKTLGDVYAFLCSYDENLKLWITRQPDDLARRIHEAVFVIFASMSLIPQLAEYTPCTGNFGRGSVKELESIEELFDDSIFRGGDGGSDYTAIDRGSGRILGTTAKYITKFTYEDLHMDKLTAGLTEIYPDYTDKRVCIVVPDRLHFVTMRQNIHQSTHSRAHEWLNRANVIDHDDLEAAFNKFKRFRNDACTPKSSSLRPHQEYTVDKTLHLKKSGEKHVLYAHISRSGKTFMMHGSILADGGSNYIVITTAPNETYEQYKNVFRNSGFKVTRLEKSTTPVIDGKNIIITSKQFLDKKDIEWLKNLTFDIAFVDEGHHGGTTDLARKALEMYTPNTFTVFMSATPQKIKYAYGIHDSTIITWDLEDINLCKNIYDPKSILRLEEKHGTQFMEVLDTYSKNSIKEMYSNFPDMHILTRGLSDDVKHQIITETGESSYGYSFKSVFGLTESKKHFQRPDEVLKLFYTLFGKRGTRMPDPLYEKCFMKRIEDICQYTDSRYIGDASDDVKVVMAFLPGDDINHISKALNPLLMNDSHLGYHRLFSDDYTIVSINSKITSDPKHEIKDAVARAKNENKRGVLVLSGSQCHMAVSVEECDVVLLLNDRSSYEMILQMMFRSMTEAPNKKCGFVVDLSLDRVLDTVISNLPNSLLSREEALKYILTSKIVSINADEWIYTPGDHHEQLATIAKKLDDLYISNGHKSILRNLDRLKDMRFELSKEQESRLGLSKMITGGTIKITGKDPIESIRDGIERKINDDEPESTPNTKRENFSDILRFIVPLFSFITCRHKESSFLGICKSIDDDPELKEICTNHISTWCLGTISTDNVLKNLVDIYIELGMHNAVDLNKTITHVKELVYKNRRDRHVMSKILDDILLVHKNDKKMNAEIPTPLHLRTEMVDKVPESFWKDPSKKVFESSVGKIGFLNEIIDKFMIGLEGVFPDETERYKHIVEQCLYFADKNQSNIHIVKAILDPDDIYTLNSNIGNSLDVILWSRGVALPDHFFDLVVQNPPYNDASGNKGTGHTLWDKFTLKAVESWLKPGGYLVAVHPGNWRQGTSEIFNLFKEKQLHYLEIHNSGDGQKTFKCGTSYDWYLLENKPCTDTTCVVGEDGICSEIDMRDWDFLPNMMFDDIKNLMGKDEELLDANYYRTNYGADKKWVSDKQVDEFVHPVINTIKRMGQLNLRYSSVTNRGLFGIPKFIFSNGGFTTFSDTAGDYGITQWSYCIYDKVENFEKLEQVFRNSKFRKIIDAIQLDSQKFNIKIMRLFKKNLWTFFS